MKHVPSSTRRRTRFPILTGTPTPMRRRCIRHVLAGSVAALFAAQTAQAVPYYWNTTTTGLWSAGVNWSDNAVALGTTGVVPLATDTAVFNQSSINGIETIQLDANTSIAGLTFANTGTTLLQSDSATPRVLTVGSAGLAVSATAGAVTLGNATNIMALTLGAAQTWTNEGTLTVLNGIDLGANLLTVTGTGSTTIQSAVSNTGGVTKSGTSSLTLNRANTYTGATTIHRGTVTLSGSSGSIAASSGVTLGGINATLTVNNSSSNSNGDRIGSVGLVSNGGTFNWLNSAGSTNYSEAIGGLTVNAGAFALNTSRTTSGFTAALTLASITRNAGGTVLFSGDGFGVTTRNQVLVTAAPTNVNGILPWAVIQDSLASASGGINLAVGGAGGAAITQLTTYTTGNGTSSNWTPVTGFANARPGANAAFTTSQSAGQINSLVLDTATTLGSSTTADRTTTVFSGLVVQTGGTSTLLGTTGSTDMILAFGATEAIFHTVGTLIWQRGNATQTTGTGGLTKTGAGTLQMGIDGDQFVNGITGTLTLNQGSLEIYSGNTTSLISLSTGISFNGGNLTIHDGTNRNFNNPLVLNADATLTADRHAAAQGTGVEFTFGTLAINNTPVLNVTTGANVTSGTEGVIVGAVALNSDATFNVTNGAAAATTLTLGTITGGAGFGLTKNGSGTLAIGSTSNAYTGVVTLNAGTLLASASTSTALGTGAATLQLNGGTLTLASSASRNYDRNTTASGNVAIITEQKTGNAAGWDYRLGTLAIGAQTLTVQAGPNANHVASSGLQSVTFGAVTLTGSATFNVDDEVVASGAVAALNLGGIGGGSNGITKSGTGVLNLTGTSTYTGATDIQNGTVALTGSLSSSTTLTLGNGATSGKFILGSAVAAVNQTVAGFSTTGAGTTNAIVGGFATDSTLTVSLATGSNTFTGALGGAATNENNLALAKAGAGLLALTGSSTYTGGTTINAGTLRAGHNNALSNSGIVILNGTDASLELADGINLARALTVATTGNNKTLALQTGATSAEYSGGITISEGSNLDFDVVVGASGTLILSGVVDGVGSSGLTKEGSGTVVLSNTNTYTGETTIHGGVLTAAIFADGGQPSSIGAAPNTSGNLVLNGGTLRHDATNVATTDRRFAVGLNHGMVDSSSVSATDILNFASTSAMGFNSQFGARTLTLTGSNTGANNISMDIDDDGAGGATTVIKSGAGSWRLSSGNTYTGGTTLNAGQLHVESNTALGTGTVTINGGTLASVVSGRTLANNVVVSADFALGGQGNGLTINGTLDLGGSTRMLTLGNSATFGGVVSNGGITVLGTTRTLTLAADGNTYTGVTTISDTDILQIGAGAGGGATGSAGNGGNIVLNGTAAALNLNRTGTLTVANTISGSGILNQIGGGVSTLTGTNTYSGQTSINNGTLSISTSANLGDESLTNTLAINGGTLQNIGAAVNLGVNRSVTVGTSGATVEVTSANLLTISGTLTGVGNTLTKTGTGILSLNGASTNVLTLTNAGGTTNVNGLLGTGTSIVNASAGAMKFGSVSQTLASLTIGAGATVTFTSGIAAFNESGGGKFPAFGGGAVVPEPGTLGLLLIGALGALRRRRA